MPKVTVTDTATLIYQAQYGTAVLPTVLSYRIDPEADTDAIVYVGNDAVTAPSDSDDDTVGIPLLAGESASDSLVRNDSVWAIAESGESFDVYFNTTGIR